MSKKRTFTREFKIETDNAFSGEGKVSFRDEQVWRASPRKTALGRNTISSHYCPLFVGEDNFARLLNSTLSLELI